MANDDTAGVPPMTISQQDAQEIARTADTATPQTDLEPFDRLPAVGSIEVDRFCEGCFYNLHGQVVRRDPRTMLPLARCPECGRFACATDLSNAGRLWLHRISTWLVGNWLMLLLLMVLGYGFFQWLNGIVLLEEMHMYMRGNYGWYREPAHAEYRRLTTLLICGSVAMALGAGFTGLFTVVVPHWKRGGAYAFGFTVLTLLAMGVCATIWHVFNYDGYRGSWAVQQLLAQTGAAIVGVLVGAFIGRPVARLLVRLLLPKKLRGPMGYLWTADNLPRPATK